jgi:EmrB/QacA subfamily drug resistance transporter
MKQDRSRSILIVLFVGVLMGALDIAIVGPALPQIQETFRVTDRTLSWMFTIYVLFNLIGTPLMAKLSDIYGRRSIYIIDVAFFGSGSLLVALSPADSFFYILAGRAIQGFGAGGIFPVASAVIGDTFPPERRGRALGLIGAVFGLAFIIGPLLGGVILTFADYHWLFLINIPIALTVIFFSLRILPSTHPEVVDPFDWRGMLVIALMLGSLAFGINQIDTSHFLHSLASCLVWSFLLLFLVCLPIIYLLEKKAESPIIPLSLFRSRQMSLTYVLSTGSGIGESSLVFLPLLAVAALNVAQSQASFLLMPVVVAMSIGSPMVGRFLDRFGSRAVILFGTAIMTGGLVLLSQFASSLILYIISGILIGAGLSALLGAPLRYIMLNEVQASQRSTAQGILTLFTSVGQLIGSATVGAVAASGGSSVSGYSLAYLAIAFLGVILWIAAFFLKNREKERMTAVKVQPQDRNQK